MASVSNRVFDVPCVAVTEEGEVIVTPDELYAFLERIGPVLIEVGGRITLEAQRVQVGELAGEPIAVTERVVGRWVANSPLRKAEPERVEPLGDPEPDIEGALADSYAASGVADA